MKLSLKFRNNDGIANQNNIQTQIMTAKLPLTIFDNPFISTITAATTTTNNNNNNNININKKSSSDFSFSLSTNFPSGPTFKLSYSPTASQLPFSLSLKSGLGIFGSPNHSPLVFSANFSLSFSSTTHTLTPLPSFFLHFKPQFGHFSLNKTVFSDNNSDPLSISVYNPQIDKGFVPVPDGSSSGWQNLNLEPCDHREDNNGVVLEMKNSEKCGLSPSIAVMARTVVPVAQGFVLNFRWGLNFAEKSGLKMPFMTVNKIGLERVEEVKQNEEMNSVTREGDLHLLKGMRRDLENVEKENREMKRLLDDMKMRVYSSSIREKNNGNVGNKVQKQQHSGESFWSKGNNKNGRQENEIKKQPNKSQNLATDLESELEKAIKAASFTT